MRMPFIHEGITLIPRLNHGVGNMAKCPKCGKDVKPQKTWKMAGKPDKQGKRTELTIGLSECCDKKFRTVLDKKKI